MSMACFACDVRESCARASRTVPALLRARAHVDEHARTADVAGGLLGARSGSACRRTALQLEHSLAEHRRFGSALACVRACASRFFSHVARASSDDWRSGDDGICANDRVQLGVDVLELLHERRRVLRSSSWRRFVDRRVCCSHTQHRASVNRQRQSLARSAERESIFAAFPFFRLVPVSTVSLFGCFNSFFRRFATERLLRFAGRRHFEQQHASRFDRSCRSRRRCANLPSL